MSAPSRPQVLTVEFVSEDLIVNIGDQSFFLGDPPRDVFAKLRESSDTRSYDWDHDEDAVEIRLPRYGIAFYLDPFMYRLQAVVCQTLDTVRIVWDGKELHPLARGAATAAEVCFVVMGDREGPRQRMKGSKPPYISYTLSWFVFNCRRRGILSRGGASNRRSQQPSMPSSAGASGGLRRRNTEGERSQPERGSAPLAQQPIGSHLRRGRGGSVTSTDNGLVNVHDNPSAPDIAAGPSDSNGERVSRSRRGYWEDNECDGLEEVDRIVFNKRRRATVSVGSILHPKEEEEGSDVEETEGEEIGSEKTLCKVILFNDHWYDELRASTKIKLFVIRYDEVGERYLQMITADQKLEEEGAMAKANGSFVHFQDTPAAIIRVLGEEYESTTPDLSPGESNELVKFRFFDRGIDVVFRREKNNPQTMKVVHFILHTCHTQHEDFLTYNRCLFSVDMPSRVTMRTEVEAISVFSTEDDVRKIATIKPEASDEQSRLYEGEGLAFKVMNGLLATVTVEEDKDMSKALDPIRLPEIPEWSVLRNAESLPIFRMPDQ